MRTALALSLCLLTASACGNPEGPTTGAIRITAAITGPTVAAPAYQVSIDGGAPVPIQADSSMVIDTAAPGDHSIQLTGIASNCTVDGPNPVTVKVTSGATASVNFDVTCLANGAIRVIVSTDGAAVPATYTVGVDSGATGYLHSAIVPANGTASITLPNGLHTVRLVTPPNCTVTSSNNVRVTTLWDASMDVLFQVSCVDGGTLRVTAATTGSGAPASYTVGVDSGSAGFRFSTAIPANGAVSIALVSGPHLVKLLVPANCTVTGPNNVSVTAAAGVTGSADFRVTCAGTAPGGTLRVTAVTSGSGAPSTYIVRAVNGSTGSQSSATIPANGTLSLALPAGDYTVTLVVPLNCAVTSPNDVPVTATAGATVNLDFVVTCAANGAVRMTVGTTGVNPDGAYQVSIDGGVQTLSVTDGSIVLASMAAGDHSIALFDIAPNCTVNGPNPVTLTVIAAVTTDLRFAVTCVGDGTIRVTVATTGPDAPAGYSFNVDGYYSVFVPANGTGSISVPLGDHTAMMFVPQNCTITSPNNVPVTVGSGAAADVAFRVTCVANGIIRVTVATTDPAPFTSYLMYLDLSEVPWRVPANGTISKTVTPGQHTLYLSLLGTCHLTPHPGSVSVIVQSGATTDVSFHVTCIASGTLRVTVTTTGTNVPATYTIDVGPGPVSTDILANGTLRFSLQPGNYAANLTVPSNCTDNPSSSIAATITSAATTDVAFTVACR